MASRDNIANEAAKRRIAAQQRREGAEAGEMPWPEPDQRTSEQQAEVEAYELARKWLEEKWGTQPTPECPYCKNNVWSVGVPTQLATVPIYSPAGRGVLPALFPVMCTNCGHTAMVNAILPGIVPAPGEGS
jgi:hypothetical protein